MRTITFVVDTVGDHGMMFAVERDEQKGPPTMKSIQEGIILGKIEAVVQSYFLQLSQKVPEEE